MAAGQSVLEEWVAVGQGGREKTEAGGVPAPPAKGNHTEPRLLGTPKKVAGFPLSEYEQRDQLGGGGGMMARGNDATGELHISETNLAESTKWLLVEVRVSPNQSPPSNKNRGVDNT